MLTYRFSRIKMKVKENIRRLDKPFLMTLSLVKEPTCYGFTPVFGVYGGCGGILCQTLIKYRHPLIRHSRGKLPSILK